MSTMKRTFALVATVVGMTLVAGSASAVSSVNLVWSTGGTEINTPSAPIVIPSTTVTAFIVLQGDALGVSSVGISILFDVNELQADLGQGVYENGAVKVSKGNVFGPIVGGVTVDNVNGVILGWDSWVGVSTGCVNCTVTLGSVVFHVVGAVDTDGPNDAIAAVLPNGIDAIIAPTGANVSGSTQFNGVEVLPEPTTALLVVGGLLGLGYAGRRSVR